MNSALLAESEVADMVDQLDVEKMMQQVQQDGSEGPVTSTLPGPGGEIASSLRLTRYGSVKYRA